MSQMIKKIGSVILLGSFMLLTACASNPTELEAPCNAYGQNCDPKIPINQWKAS